MVSKMFISTLGAIGVGELETRQPPLLSDAPTQARPHSGHESRGESLPPSNLSPPRECHELTIALLHYPTQIQTLYPIMASGAHGLDLSTKRFQR